MRFLTTGFLLLAMASVSMGATVYTGPSVGLEGWIVPDLTDPGFDALGFTLTTNDVDDSIDYVFSFTGHDYAGTMTKIIPDLPAIPGVQPHVATWLDATAGTGTDGGHVSMQLITYDAAVAFDPDALFSGRDGALVTLGNEAGGDPRFATIAVPEPGTMTLLGMGVLFAAHPIRRRLKNRA